MRVEVYGLGLLLALLAGPVPADEPADAPDAELLEFLGQFGADDEAFGLALDTVVDESGSDEQPGAQAPVTAEETDDESR